MKYGTLKLFEASPRDHYGAPNSFRVNFFIHVLYVLYLNNSRWKGHKINFMFILQKSGLKCKKSKKNLDHAFVSYKLGFYFMEKSTCMNQLFFFFFPVRTQDKFFSSLRLKKQLFILSYYMYH